MCAWLRPDAYVATTLVLPVSRQLDNSGELYPVKRDLIFNLFKYSPMFITTYVRQRVS